MTHLLQPNINGSFCSISAGGGIWLQWCLKQHSRVQALTTLFGYKVQGPASHKRGSCCIESFWDIVASPKHYTNKPQSNYMITHDYTWFIWLYFFLCYFRVGFWFVLTVSLFLAMETATELVFLWFNHSIIQLVHHRTLPHIEISHGQHIVYGLCWAHYFQEFWYWLV